jgi:disulfide bond formation protein DsbB
MIDRVKDSTFTILLAVATFVVCLAIVAGYQLFLRPCAFNGRFRCWYARCELRYVPSTESYRCVDKGAPSE